MEALSRPRGLSGIELAAALQELTPALVGAQVRGIARLEGQDDLLLFLERDSVRSTLQVALGATRARIVTTTRRFPRGAFASGPLVDRLAERFAGARLKGFAQPTGERRVALTFTHPEQGRLELEVELFGNRGLWVLCDAAGRILELSRIPHEADRTLAPGSPYVPPRSHGVGADAAPRFAPPLLPAIDAHFTAADLEAERGEARSEAERAVTTAKKRLEHKLAGLVAQQAEITKAPELRRRADLLLAYAFSIPRGSRAAEVPDPEREGSVLRIELDPAKPVREQIEALYDRARRLEDATEVSRARQEESRRALAEVEELAARLAAAVDDDAFATLREELVRRGLLRSAPAPAAGTPRPAAKERKETRGERFRRFVSAEGYAILCGKSNEENDKLSLRVAAGNDLWFHVGQGYAGSHVVLRLPKGKTASLESLLDAGTIAIHFSKARAATVCDVDYTFAKFVRKPKGFPPGKVTITQNKTLRVRMEKERLARLLAGSSGES